MLAYGFEKLELQKIFLRLLRMIEDRRETVNLEQGKREVFFMEAARGAWESSKHLGME